MLIYSIVFLLLLFGVFHYDHRKNIFLGNVYYFLVFTVMTLMTGLRYRTGGDSLMYEDYYPYLPNLDDLLHFISSDTALNYQPLYLLFVALCKVFSPDYYFYQMMHALVVNSVIFWFIQRNTRYRYTVLLLMYFFLIYFYFSFEVQREILGVCCFLLAFQYFEKNNWIVYYLFAVVAFFFHISAIILFILPLFKIIIFTRRFIILTVIATFPLIFLKEYLFSIFEIFLVTETMQTKGEVYSEVEFSIVGVLSFYFVRVVVALPFLFASVKNRFSKHWLLAAYLVLAISAQIMVGFDRFMNYIYLPFFIYITESIYTQFGHQKISWLKRRFIVVAVMLHLFFILDYKVVMDMGVTNRARYQAVFFPYESVFEKEKNSERENFMRELWKR